MNGAATLRLVPASASAEPMVDKPSAEVITLGAAPAPTAVEIEIGSLIAQAAGLIAAAAEKNLAGQSTLSASMRVGELIARLYELQQSVGPGFADVAIRAGRSALMRTLAPDVARHGDLTPALDEALSWPLNVLARGIESERQFAN